MLVGLLAPRRRRHRPVLDSADRTPGPWQRANVPAVGAITADGQPINNAEVAQDLDRLRRDAIHSRSRYLTSGFRLEVSQV